MLCACLLCVVRHVRCLMFVSCCCVFVYLVYVARLLVVRVLLVVVCCSLCVAYCLFARCALFVV